MLEKMAAYNDSHLLDINRVGKITASVAAAIMGIDPYTSRQKAWRRITGNETEAEKSEGQNYYQQQGNENEAGTLAAFEAATGMLLLPGRFIIHHEIPWLGASPDSLTYKGRVPVECKSMTEDRKKYLDEIAPYYLIQCQVQIQCCNTTYGWFYQQGGGHKPFLLRVERDDKYFWETIYPALHSFYFDYVEKNVPPPRKGAKQ